jgi:hypothetical protein
MQLYISVNLGVFIATFWIRDTPVHACAEYGLEHIIAFRHRGPVLILQPWTKFLRSGPALVLSLDL